MTLTYFSVAKVTHHDHCLSISLFHPHKHTSTINKFHLSSEVSTFQLLTLLDCVVTNQGPELDNTTEMRWSR